MTKFSSLMILFLLLVACGGQEVTQDNLANGSELEPPNMRVRSATCSISNTHPVRRDFTYGPDGTLWHVDLFYSGSDEIPDETHELRYSSNGLVAVNRITPDGAETNMSAVYYYENGDIQSISRAAVVSEDTTIRRYAEIFHEDGRMKGIKYTSETVNEYVNFRYDSEGRVLGDSFYLLENGQQNWSASITYTWVNDQVSGYEYNMGGFHFLITYEYQNGQIVSKTFNANSPNDFFNNELYIYDEPGGSGNLVEIKFDPTTSFTSPRGWCTVEYEEGPPSNIPVGISDVVDHGYPSEPAGFYYTINNDIWFHGIALSYLGTE